MSNAEEIRAHVVTKHIEPARKNHHPTVSFVSGDIHDDLKYSQRYPAVCSAIDTKIFEKVSRATLVSRTGPKHGPKVRWTFSV